jgi:hypothetical protein
MHGKVRSAYRVLVGKPKEERSLVRPRHIWEDNIKPKLEEIMWEVVNWIYLTQEKDEW